MSEEEARGTLTRNPAILGRSTRAFLPHARRACVRPSPPSRLADRSPCAERLVGTYAALCARGLSPREARALVVAAPRILTHSSEERVAAALERLRWATQDEARAEGAAVGEDDGEKGRIAADGQMSERVKALLISRPWVLTVAPSTGKLGRGAGDGAGGADAEGESSAVAAAGDRLVEVLGSATGMPAGQVRAVLARCPELLGTDIDQRVLPALAILESAGLKPEHVRAVIRKAPQACPATSAPCPPCPGGVQSYLWRC